jgi:DNA-binding transcriptional LysR family regulator
MDDMSGLDLNLLRSLAVLIEEGNVTHAAARLGISQPGLSAQLARLRALFDDPLLVPSERGRGMVPTPRALDLREPLRGALAQLQAVVRTSRRFAPETDTRDFRIDTTENALVALGLPLLARVGAVAGPGIRIAFTNFSGDVATQLERGAVDLMLGSRRMIPAAMTARKLMDETYVMIQRRGHPRGTAPLDLDAYCALEHVLVSTSGGHFHGFIDEQLAPLGYARRVALSVHQFGMAPAIVATTDYVSTLPRRFAMHFRAEVDVFDLPFPVQGFSLHMAWHPRTNADPGLSWLRQTLLEAIHEGS